MSNRALPLLSSVAPRTEQANNSPSCHRCGKEFGIITRRKICSHCGFAYCGSCCDHQAVCPRDGNQPGYETVNVCSWCIEMLSITASGKSQLRTMQVARLKAYLDAYGIKPKSMLEKDDLIEAIIDARGLNGGLSSDHEAYYRRQTISRRSPVDSTRRHNFFTSSFSSSSSRPAPPLRPRSTGPGVQPSSNRPTSPPPQRPPPMPGRNSDPRQHYAQPPYAQPQTNPGYQQVPPQGGQYHYQQPPYAQNYHQQTHFQSPPPQPQQRPMSPNPQYGRPQSPRQERPPPHQGYAPPPGPPPRPQSPPPRTGAASPPPQPRWNTRPQSPPPDAHLRPPQRSRSRSTSDTSAYPGSQIPPPATSPRPRGPQTVPILATLLDKSREDVQAYSITVLKGILQANHVNARLILEKSELVEKVMSLIETERRERAREEAIHRAEEEAAREQQMIRMEQMKAQAERRASASASASGTTSPNSAPTPPLYDMGGRGSSPTSGMGTKGSMGAGGFVERDGLCVVCQDEEANIAIVDCGHLALCMDCSHTIMNSTRECPLCRTRIVTEQRLLRIFRS